MVAAHVLEVEVDNGAELLFACPEASCGRRVVVHRGRGDYTVLDQGDFFATHTGAVGGLRISVS